MRHTCNPSAVSTDVTSTVFALSTGRTSATLTFLNKYSSNAPTIEHRAASCSPRDSHVRGSIAAYMNIVCQVHCNK